MVRTSAVAIGLSALAVLGPVTTLAHAQDRIHQLIRLTRGQDATSRSFGGGISLDGHLALIAGKELGVMSTTPVAILYDVSSPSHPIELREFRTDTVQSVFSSSPFRDIGLLGNTAIIGSPHDGYSGMRQAGAAFIYDTNSGTRLARIEAPTRQPYSQFGRAVALGGERSQPMAVVGAPLGTDSFGRAHVFDARTGQLLYTLLPDQPMPYDSFGGAVSASRTIALVGAPGSGVNGDGAGTAFVFDLDSGQLKCELVASDGMPSDGLGDAVANSEELAIVGAPFCDEFGSNSGAVYVFDSQTGEELCKIVSPDPVPGSWFGWSVAIDDNRILIPQFIDARHPEQGPGPTYVFDVSDPTDPVLVSTLVIERPTQHGGAGLAIGLSGTTALVGAPFVTTTHGARTGATFIFSFERKLPRPDDEVPDRLPDFTRLAPCPADWNADGNLNGGDYIAYFADFIAVSDGREPAHRDPDLADPASLLNTADFATFINTFVTGCGD